MNNKSSNNRSKEEVDNFNKLVNEVNKEVGNHYKFNTVRTNAINNWDVTEDNFIARYILIE